MSTAILSEIKVTRPARFNSPVTTSVSVIIPCYNEEQFIGKALVNLANQYPAGQYEIIIVDGMSTDRTREVIEKFEVAHPELHVRVIDNPARAIPHALNLGIAAARGEIIARMDAHAVPSAGYIRRCVAVLNEEQVAVVGMPCRVQPADQSLTARSIAIAVSHPFGIGDAKYRLGHEGSAQEQVDTVAFACFRKSLWSNLGGFNEQLLTNEDYDFNYRVRARGLSVLLDRSEHCDYFARSTFRKLAAQYLRYGAWKARMVRQHPRSLKLRHLIAPAFVASTFVLALLGFGWRAAWILLGVEFVAYASAAGYFAFRATAKSKETFGVMGRLPFLFFTIHASWGASFWWGLLTRGKGNNATK
jgi:glycosyltransferase involved in cell wall biosynthesis